MSDQELMANYYQCHDEALDHIYNNYRARIVQFVRNCGLSETEAEDSLQDLFLRVMETKHGNRRGAYDPQKGASVKTWLFTIANRLVTDIHRKSGRSVSFSDLDEETEEGEEYLFEDTLAADQITPEEQALANEWQEAVHECMQSLPDRERVAIALWLETGGDMKLKDLAATLEVSEPTAHRVLKKAFQLMRDCLERKGLSL